MALRSLLRKAPALAGGLTSPVSHGPSPSLRPVMIQALRFLSHGPSASGSQAVYSEELLREKEDRAYAEFERNMKVIQQQRDEQWRLEVEFWANLHRQLHTVEKTCNVLLFLCVPAVILSLTNAMQ